MKNTSESLHEESPEITESNNTVKAIVEVLKDVVAVLFTLFCIHFFFVAAFRVDGRSMENTYRGGEFILVNRFSYLDFSTHFDDFLHENADVVSKAFFGTLKKIPIHIGDPKRGDVVVIKPHLEGANTYFFKRIIGLPGDTIRFSSGSVFIKTPMHSDFVQLNESYLSLVNSGNTFLPPYIDETDFKIPE